MRPLDMRLRHTPNCIQLCSTIGICFEGPFTITCFLLLYYYADEFFFFLQKCVKDTLSPISIKLDFTQDDSQSSSAVLNVDSRKQAVIEVY